MTRGKVHGRLLPGGLQTVMASYEEESRHPAESQGNPGFYPALLQAIFSYLILPGIIVGQFQPSYDFTVDLPGISNVDPVRAHRV